MAAKKTTKKVKKVTEIPEAKVTIEVEQTEDKETEDIVTSAPQDVEIEEKTTETREYSEKHTIDDGEEKSEEEASETEVDSASNEEVPEDNSDQTEEAEQSDENVEEDTKQEEPFSDDPNSGDSFSWKKVIIFAVIAAAIGFVIVGGFLYFRTGYKINISKTSDSKSIDVPTKEPTPTPESVDKTAYQIEVLNGSGIAGEAAAVQEILEDAGYTVGSIGNATNQDFTATTISANDNVKQGFIDELKETLEKRGPVDVVETSSEQDTDVVVTVGSDLNDEVTPTP